MTEKEIDDEDGKWPRARGAAAKAYRPITYTSTYLYSGFFLLFWQLTTFNSDLKSVGGSHLFWKMQTCDWPLVKKKKKPSGKNMLLQ